MELELEIMNHGAVARDVHMQFGFRGPKGLIQGHPRTQVEPVLPPGQGRRFLLSPGEALMPLRGLGDAKLTIETSWSWLDDRRRLWHWDHRHARFASYPATELVEGFYGGWALTRHDPDEDLHEIADAGRKLAGDVHRIGEELERERRIAASNASTVDAGRAAQR